MGKIKTTYTVNAANGLNLREEPSKDARVIAILKYGDKVKIDPKRVTKEDWMAVVGGGYVMAAYLK